MDLHREPFARVEQLDQDRKSRCRVALIVGSKDLFTPGRPKLVQSGSAQRSAVHDALRVLAVHDLPGFSDGHTVRQDFSEEVLKAASAPDALHGKRFKNDRFGVGHPILFLRLNWTLQFLLQSFRGACGFREIGENRNFMANKPKGYGTWDAALGLILCGLAVLLFLALVSYQPSDLPSWAKLIYDSNARSPDRA